MITILLEIIYLFAALLQLFVAPRVGPNPYFGFKIGYTFSNREVWKKSNTFVGLLMTLHALAILPIALMGDEHIWLYLSVYIIPLMGIVAAGIVYAKRELEWVEGKEVSREPIKPLDVGFLWRHSSLFIFLALLAFMLLTYSSLPNVLAVHFDSNGNPNGWAAKDDFLLQYSSLSLIYVGIVYILVYVGRRYPIALHSGVMRIGRDTVLKATIIAMNIGLLILLIVYGQIYLYNTGHSIELIYSTIAMVLAAILAPVLYVVWRWRKEKNA